MKCFGNDNKHIKATITIPKPTILYNLTWRKYSIPFGDDERKRTHTLQSRVKYSTMLASM